MTSERYLAASAVRHKAPIAKYSHVDLRFALDNAVRDHVMEDVKKFIPNGASLDVEEIADDCNVEYVEAGRISSHSPDKPLIDRIGVDANLNSIQSPIPETTDGMTERRDTVKSMKQMKAIEDIFGKEEGGYSDLDEDSDESCIVQEEVELDDCLELDQLSGTDETVGEKVELLEVLEKSDSIPVGILLADAGVLQDEEVLVADHTENVIIAQEPNAEDLAAYLRPDEIAKLEGEWGRHYEYVRPDSKRRNVFTDFELLSKTRRRLTPEESFKAKERLKRRSLDSQTIQRTKEADEARSMRKIEQLDKVVMLTEAHQKSQQRGRKSMSSLDLVLSTSRGLMRERTESEKLFKILMEFDDILTDLLIDCFYLSFVTHKMNSDYETKYSLLASKAFEEQKMLNLAEEISQWFRDISSGRKTCDDVVDIVTNAIFYPTKNAVELKYTSSGVFEDAAQIVKASLSSVKVDGYLSHFKRHAKRYLSMYLPKAGYEIDRTYRYKDFDKIEGRLCATKLWKAGDEIKAINGFIAELSDADEVSLASRDFSVMFSSKRGKMCLFTGPARFMNHDCVPNCKFIPLFRQEISFKIIKDIAVGEELTTFYGADYFGDENCECLCATCEKNGRGGFAQVETCLKNGMSRKKRNPTDKVMYKDLTPADLILIQKNEGANLTRNRAISLNKNCCEICSMQLDEFTKPVDRKDTSRMPDTYCSRCYRHQLIYDIEWPERKFLLKISNLAASKRRTKDSDDLRLGVAVKGSRDGPQLNDENAPGERISGSVKKPIAIWMNPGEDCPTWWPGIVNIKLIIDCTR